MKMLAMAMSLFSLAAIVYMIGAFPPGPFEGGRRG